MVALAAAVASSVQADCLPTPPPSGPIVCSGATVGTVGISSSTTVTVQAGANLTRGDFDRGAVTVTSTGASGTAATLNVEGIINGLPGYAVLVGSGTVSTYTYPSTRLDIVVGQSGGITGHHAIHAYGEGSSFTTAGATLDNSGRVEGEYALYATDFGRAGFLSVNNRATGLIRGNYTAILGSVMSLTNAGLIQSGLGPAYSLPIDGGYAITPQSINNSGTIVSGSGGGTLHLRGGYLTITNSGQIRNTAGGLAIDAANRVNLTNAAGGLIRAAGGGAIRAGGGALTNRGTIDGSVTLTGQATFDNVGGTLNGDLLFSAYDDTLVAAWDNANGRLAGISGSINGGGGTNTLRFDLAQDANVDALVAGVALPTNFQNLALNLSNDAKISLTGDAPDGLMINGAGSFTTSGAITTNGAALKLGFYYPSALTFANTGTITATFNPPTAFDPNAINTYALDVRSTKAFSNEGTITSVGGNGVTAYMDYAGALTNSGSIIATGMGLNLNGGLNNSGLIRSLEGVGLTLTGYSSSSTNSGTVEGVTIGASVSGGTFANIGTIQASNGVGVKAGSYATIDNQAGGVITGTRASVSRDGGDGFYTAVLNAGTLNGDVDLRNAFAYSDDRNLYGDLGGVLNGSLFMGTGWDTVITDLSRLADGRLTGVTGTVDAGGGTGVDTLLVTVQEDATRTLSLPDSFEQLALELVDGASLNLTLDQPMTRTLALTGEGDLDLTADISVSQGNYAISLFGPSAAQARNFGYGTAPGKLSVISRGALTVTSTPYYYGVGVALGGDATFENAGSLTVTGDPNSSPTPIGINGGGTVINSGVITLSSAIGVSGATSFTNTGTVKQAAGAGTSIGAQIIAKLVNSGTIETAGTAVALYNYSGDPSQVTNTGVIRSTGADAINGGYSKLELTNSVTGVIESTTGYAITSYGDSVHIANDGAITGDIGLQGYNADQIDNLGTITGDITTGYGDDVVVNTGTITGDVALGDGNDSFTLGVAGLVNGVVDGGYGLDTLNLDASKGGTVSSSRFINFERFRQTGGGSLVYSGVFLGAPIIIAGGGAEVLAGTSVTAPGATTFLGTDLSEQVTIGGTISGGVSLGDGVDTVTNRGAIGASVLLGAGDDVYTEGAGSTVAGAIDGGAGGDTYIAELAGDRTGLHARTGFERLGVVGTGKLTLALDQNWESVNLAGANLDLTQGGFTVGALSAGDGAESVSLQRDIASVSLGGGDDRLTVDAASLAGGYVGGGGADSLTLSSAAPVTLTGSISGFETLSLSGGRLDVSGALGAADDVFGFGAGDQTLSILSGGVLAGTADLGDGADILNLAAGGMLSGSVSGGAGNDLVAIDLLSDLTLKASQLQQFEILKVTGSGALNFTGGAAKFDIVQSGSDSLTVMAGSSLAAGSLTLNDNANVMTVAGAFSGQLDLAGGDDTLRILSGGNFAGSADGGSGNDRIELSLAGTDTAPVSLGSVGFSGFETLSLQGGVVSVASDYGFDRIEVANGRLIGLAGSRLTGDVTVARGATFGSAGSVVGDVTVAGTLSPGASPGTMTVTGDVTLLAGSTSVFEITPTVSDKLVVSGDVTIASGSTLKLVGDKPLTPGRTLDLIVAGGRLTGAFTTVDGAQALGVHLSTSTGGLRALGVFTGDSAFSPQVSGVIGYLNDGLINGNATAAQVAAMPSLVTAAGYSDPAALARLTPQAYASASQIGIENGLSIIDATRGQARIAPRSPGVFGFGQAITGQRKLDGDAAAGVSKGKMDGTGVLTGLGYGVDAGWVGAFVGYLDGRQRIADLGAHTDIKSFVFGVQGQARFGDLALGASLSRDSADADTDRTVVGGVTTGAYKLRGWTADANLTYAHAISVGWLVQPRLGASYVTTERTAVTERGGVFALGVAADKAKAWFVDGEIAIVGGQASDARLRPYGSIGFRTKVGGRDGEATASLAGIGGGFTVDGLQREGSVATIGAGLHYAISQRLTLSASYAGEFGDSGRQGALLGLNFQF